MQNSSLDLCVDSTGDITDEIFWGHQPLARKVNGAWYYYIYNAHGDVVGLVDDNGNIKNTYTYDPWGNILSETETVDNPIKYAGEYYDDELGMIYLRARCYNPQIGETQGDGSVVLTRWMGEPSPCPRLSSPLSSLEMQLMIPSAVLF